MDNNNCKTFAELLEQHQKQVQQVEQKRVEKTYQHYIEKAQASKDKQNKIKKI